MTRIYTLIYTDYLIINDQILVYALQNEFVHNDERLIDYSLENDSSLTKIIFIFIIHYLLAPYHSFLVNLECRFSEPNNDDE